MFFSNEDLKLPPDRLEQQQTVETGVSEGH